MSDFEHHLVLVTRLWADAPIVFGIYATREDAEATVAEVSSAGPSPDEYRHEIWRDGQRVG
ncbi:hypothetical protein C5C74_08285 [Rathayibacter sp. AY1E8]|uniref:hypothetical protein n=1 Tax=Rathayibacter sp. AY1E8 TaxID=2080555 RepID=UPI000CE79D50|nr:hypothetical protein [Rathayibacter sp. AY1E8]PPG18964.1 hypothetical protein C5C74_08285 [Rathayibacter sp. AY1E8]